MELTEYKVKALINPHGEYGLGAPAQIIDEVVFYRIEGTHILDQQKIKIVVVDGDRVKVDKMTADYHERVIEIIHRCFIQFMRIWIGY